MDLECMLCSLDFIATLDPSHVHGVQLIFSDALVLLFGQPRYHL